METLWTQIAGTSWIEWLGTLTGISAVWLSIREKTVAWPLFIVCYASYVILSLRAGLLAAVFMNLVFIGLSLYGWWRWARKAEADAPASEVTTTPARDWAVGIACWLGGTLLIGFVLSSQTEAFRPFFDAFATSGAFVAQWMLGRKQLGTWLCWLISDAVFIWLWSAQGYWLTLVLYAVFVVLAIHGWKQWREIIRQGPSLSPELRPR